MGGCWFWCSPSPTPTPPPTPLPPQCHEQCSACPNLVDCEFGSGLGCLWLTDSNSCVAFSTQARQSIATLGCGDSFEGETTSLVEAHYFDFNLPSNLNGASITIDTCGSLYDTMVFLFNSNEQLITQQDDSDQCGWQSHLIVDNVQGGNYIIRVDGYMNQVGKYDLKVTCSVPANPVCPNYLHFTGISKPQSIAQMGCEALGSDLATIKTPQDLQCAIDLVNDHGGNTAWIGLYSVNDVCGFFQPIDGTDCPIVSNGKYSGACVGKQFWNNGEPKCINDGGSKCVRLVNNKFDNDILCRDTLPGYLCNNPNYVSSAKAVNEFSVNFDPKYQLNHVNGTGISGELVLGIIILLGLLINIIVCYFCVCKNKNNKKKVNANEGIYDVVPNEVADRQDISIMNNQL